METLRKSLFLMLIFINLRAVVAQQSATISGTIMDQEIEGEPLLFAHVSLKHTSWTEQTNFHGNFTFLDVIPGEYTLVVSYLGYETLEIPVLVKMGETILIKKNLSALSINSEQVVSLSSEKIIRSMD